MATLEPAALEAMAELPGVGERKLARYGERGFEASNSGES